MIHTCSICGRKKDCGNDADCDRPEIIPMNCGVPYPIHQEAYLKVIGVKK